MSGTERESKPMQTVLIIDDSPNLRQQLVEMLSMAGIFDQHLVAADGLEGFRLILDNPVDLVLCDLEMPRMDGFRFITMMQGRDELRDVPVIMLTSREDSDLKVKVLGQGAVDYVTKPFDAGELLARVKVQLKIKALQDQLKHSNEVLMELSKTDPLTRLFNRRHLMEAVEREYTRSARKLEPLSLVFSDIDHFKRVNDTYGHQEGDQVLSQVGRYMGAMVRRYDIAARYGGEEFVTLLPDTPLHQAVQFAERIRLGVQQLAFSGAIKDLTVTVSLGVATLFGNWEEGPDALFRQADAALYLAKQKGRNRVETTP